MNNNFKQQAVVLASVLLVNITTAASMLALIKPYFISDIQEHLKQSNRQLESLIRESEVFTANQSGMIELASNNRMATIVAYHIKNGATLDSLIANGYLDALSASFKQDFIDDNIYTRLSAFNANAEFVVNSSTTRLIRSKWEAKISSGSHFDLRPGGRLLLPSESVSIPVCNTGFMPYIAYVVASPLSQLNTETDVDITEENALTPQYRFILKIDGAPSPFNTDYRILADIGCSPVPDEVKTKALSNK